MHACVRACVRALYALHGASCLLHVAFCTFNVVHCALRCTVHVASCACAAVPQVSATEICNRLRIAGLLAKPTHDTIIRFAPPLVIERCRSARNPQYNTAPMPLMPKIAMVRRTLVLYPTVLKARPYSLLADVFNTPLRLCRITVAWALGAHGPQHCYPMV